MDCFSIVDSCPCVFRFMDDEYIDKFLAEGDLRISSILSMRAVNDEQRRDRREGSLKCRFYNPRLRCSPCLESVPSENSYALCTSLSPYALNDKYRSCLVVLNPSGLLLAVRSALEKSGHAVSGVRMGPCVYIGRDFCATVPDTMADDQEQKRHLDKLLAIAKGDAAFVKEPSFLVESEYRLVWDLEGEIDPNKSHIDVTVDRPRCYCEKMTLTKSGITKYQRKIMRVLNKLKCGE